MKKLFWAVLMPLAFTACTNEELISIETPESENGMVTLGENFALGVTKEGSSAETRAQYLAGGDIQWRPELDALNNPMVDKIGLSWLGINDGKVYTNYLFEHFAWPVAGTTPDIDECTGKWNDLVFLAETDHTKFGGTNSGFVKTWAETDYVVTPTLSTGCPTPNYDGAYFKTENLTIFGGNYIAYSPYDETMVEAKNLVAKAKPAYTGVYAVKRSEANGQVKALKGLANEMFYVGALNNLQGGTTAQGFELSNVTGFVQLAIVKNNNSLNINNIAKVAVYSEDGIIYEQPIDASKVKAAQDAENIASSLIAAVRPSEETEGNVKTTKLLLASLAQNVNIDFGYYYQNSTNEANACLVHIPALPQTITNAQVLIIDKDGNSFITSVGDIQVVSNKTAKVKVNVNSDLQSEIYYVVDMPTFQTAMTNAAKIGSDKFADIRLLNDIVYDKKYTTYGDGVVWVNRDMKISGGDIIVPAGQTLVIEHIGALHANSDSKNFDLTLESNIKLEDACCGADAAKVSIYGILNTNDKDDKPSITIDGDITVETGAVLNIGKNNDMYTNIAVTGTVENAGTLTVDGNVGVDVTTLNNKALVDIKNTNATPVANQNIVTVGTLTTEKDVNVGAYTELVVNTALTNSGTLNIAKSGVSGSNETDGTVTNKGTATNKGDINNQGVYDNFGTTALEDGSKFTDYVGSQYGVNMPTKTENAEYICIVNTSDKTDGDRLGYALGSKMPTTTVRFETTATHEYQLKDYYQLKGNKLATVKYVINTPSTDFVIKNAVSDGTQVVFGKELTIKDATSVTFNGYSTKVNGNVTVEKGKLMNNGTNSALVEVGGNLTIKAATLEVQPLKNAIAATESTTPSWVIGGDVQLTTNVSVLYVLENAALDVNGNLSTNVAGASATFEYSSYSDIAGKITNNGTFTRILSSGLDTANPAQVWCTGYENNGVQHNAGPQVYVAE